MHSHSARTASARIRTFAILATAVLTLAAVTSLAWAQASEGDLPFDPDAHRGTLGNGLTYYVKENREPLNRAQLRLALRAGSILEEEDERGLAHYVEHMAFDGTERFAGHEIIEYLESIGSKFGPDLNAHTSFDETVYKIEIPTDDAAVIETAFEMLSDWAFAITFDPEEVEQERGVVLEEWRTRRGAGARIRDLQYPVLFGDSRYSERLPIGLPEVIETATPDDLRAFYERWYRPDLMAVAVVGDFDAEQMVERIRRHFAPPPEGDAYQERAARPEAPTVRPEYPVPAHAEPRVTVNTDPEMSATTLRIYAKLPPRTGQSLATYRHLLTRSLFAMMANSRLFERTQVADPPFIGAWFGQGLLLANTAVLYASVRVDEDGVERGLDTVLEEMQRILRHGFTATELEREKANLLRSMESAWLERDQRPSVRLVEEYVRHYMEGESVPGIDAEYELHQQLLPEITLQEVSRLAEPWHTLDSTVAMISGPDAVASGPEVEQALLAKLRAAGDLQVDPYEDVVSDIPLLADLPEPGSITAEDPIESVDAVRWTLSNGVTVIAKQTDFRNDEVLLKATSPGGTSLVADGDYIAAITATAIAAGSGAGVHDRVALDKLLAGNTAAAAPFIGALFEGFSGSSSPEDLETLLQLVTLYGTAPRLDPTYYASYSSRLRSNIENRRAQPDAVFADTIRSALSQDHFRSRPFTLAVLDEMDLERSAAVYQDRFADFGDFTFIIVGAFDWDRPPYTGEQLPGRPAGGRPPGAVAGSERRPAAGGGGSRGAQGHRTAQPHSAGVRRRDGLEPAGGDGDGGAQGDAAGQGARAHRDGTGQHLFHPRGRVGVAAARPRVSGVRGLRQRPGTRRRAAGRGVREHRLAGRRRRTGVSGQGQGADPRSARGAAAPQRLLAGPDRGGGRTRRGLQRGSRLRRAARSVDAGPGGRCGNALPQPRPLRARGAAAGGVRLRGVTAGARRVRDPRTPRGLPRLPDP